MMHSVMVLVLCAAFWDWVRPMAGTVPTAMMGFILESSPWSNQEKKKKKRWDKSRGSDQQNLHLMPFYQLRYSHSTPALSFRCCLCLPLTASDVSWPDGCSDL